MSVRTSLCQWLPLGVWLLVFLVAIGTGVTSLAAGIALPRGDWEKHGLPTALREELRTLLREQVVRRRIPGGSLLMVHKGEVIFAEGFGYADIATKRPFKITDPVKIASITKPIVATGVVALAADGKVSLDEPVSKWLPEFREVKLFDGQRAARSPTIRELLSHTGGAPVDESPQGRPWLRDWSNDPNITLADAVKRLSDTGLAWEPRTKFGYSGSGFDTAVCAVEAATGLNFEQQLAERVFKPLGMMETTFRPTDAVRAAIPTGYNLTTNGLVASTRKPRERNATTYVTYGGNLISTAEDLAKFLLLQLQRGEWQGRQIIPGDAIRMMHKPPEWSRTGYGLGWSLGSIDKDGSRITIGHTGSSGTACNIDFKKQLVWVFFTQMPAPTSAAMTQELTFHSLVRSRLKEIATALK